MSAPAHTPAPWTPKLYEAGDCWHIHFDFNDVPTGWLGEVYLDADPVTAEADARLIAASPDLLAALSLILPLAKGYRPEGQTATARRTCDSWIEAAEAAIAKATGQ